jgi:rhamnulokinase
MATMAAVDLGAQSGRVALGRFDGETLTVTETHRFANVPVSSAGSLRWNVRDLFRNVLDGLRAAARKADVDSVAVDSWGVDFGLVDADGELLEDPVHYRDARRAEAFRTVFERVPARELYDRTGIQLLPINTLYELAAMASEHDPVLGAAERLLLMPDLFHHRLCGSRTTERTNATTTQCYDPVAGAWADDLLARLGISADLFPEVVPPGTPLGSVTAEIAADTGLDRATVVAAATHDTGSAVAAAPFARAGSIFLSVGTWSLVGVELDEPLINDETFDANLTNEGGVAGTTRLLRNVTGLWLLHECRRVWAALGEELSFEQLVELARAAPPFGPLIDPNADAFLEPGEMPRQIADACAAGGQRRPGGIGETVRCVLESLALKHAETVDLLRRVAGVEPSELYVLGGGARNDLLCQWTADASGLPVLAGPEEATLLGNLLVQAMALGEVGSIDEARAIVRRSFASAVYEPGGDDAWADARGRFTQLAAGPEVKV